MRFGPHRLRKDETAPTPWACPLAPSSPTTRRTLALLKPSATIRKHGPPRVSMRPRRPDGPPRSRAAIGFLRPCAQNQTCAWMHPMLAPKAHTTCRPRHSSGRARRRCDPQTIVRCRPRACRDGPPPTAEKAASTGFDTPPGRVETTKPSTHSCLEGTLKYGVFLRPAQTR